MAEYTVRFSQAAMDAIGRCSAASGRSIEETVSDALGFYDWARGMVAKGHSIAGIDHRKNKVREYITPFNKDLP